MWRKPENVSQVDQKRRQIGKRYIREITNPPFVVIQAHPENTDPVYHLFVVTVDDPEHFLAYMQERGIECNRLSGAVSFTKGI